MSDQPFTQSRQMTCPRCGEPYPPEATFCGRCGANLKAVLYSSPEVQRSQVSSGSQPNLPPNPQPPRYDPYRGQNYQQSQVPPSTAPTTLKPHGESERVKQCCVIIPILVTAIIAFIIFLVSCGTGKGGCAIGAVGAGTWLFLALAVVASTGLIVWCLVDVLFNEIDAYGQKIVWLLVIFFLPLIGALIYLIFRRPQRMSQIGQ